MNTLTQEALANSGTPAVLFQSSQGVPLGWGRKGLYDPYADAVAIANDVKDGTQAGLNAAANAGAVTGAPNSVYGGGGGNTNVDGGGVSQSNYSDIGWPWGDTTEQFPITAFGISGLSGMLNGLHGIMDDAMSFAQKPVFGFPLWAIAGVGMVGAVSLGLVKNPLKKGRRK